MIPSVFMNKGSTKRLYKDVKVAETAGGFTVELDGRPIKTPAKRPFVVAVRPVADAVAKEWCAQEEKVCQEAMPMMRFVCTSLDQVAPQRTAVEIETARYCETDLLCYRAKEPEELVCRQAAAWQPLLDWAGVRYDAQLAITTEVTAIEQDDDAIKNLSAAVRRVSNLTLTGLHFAAGVTGSLIVSLALLEGEIDAERAWLASHVDEHWQLQRWGADKELSNRLENLRREVSAVSEFLALSRH